MTGLSPPPPVVTPHLPVTGVVLVMSPLTLVVRLPPRHHVTMTMSQVPVAVHVVVHVEVHVVVHVEVHVAAHVEVHVVVHVAARAVVYVAVRAVPHVVVHVAVHVVMVPEVLAAAVAAAAARTRVTVMLLHRAPSRRS